MFKDKEILEIAKEAKKEFSRLHNVDCEIVMKGLDEFWTLAKKSSLIQQEIRLGLPLKVGSLVVHGKGELIVLNKEIINNLTTDKNYIKALVIHELYHVLLKNDVSNLKKAAKSENKDNHLFSKEFPSYYKILGFL